MKPAKEVLTDWQIEYQWLTNPDTDPDLLSLIEAVQRDAQGEIEQLRSQNFKCLSNNIQDRAERDAYRDVLEHVAYLQGAESDSVIGEVLARFEKKE